MNVIEFLKKDRFVNMLGIELLEASNGTAKARLMVNDDHLNALGTVQGGVIFSLADLTLAAAANSYGTVAVTLNVNISFIKAAGKGALYAEAHEISGNNKISTYEITVTDSNGNIVSCAQGMAYFKKELF